ncbi:peptidoglycan editing factor PgeF [Motiliproteus coralliicola]|uniref:Purine nucleoside phosphorylase n=1 Tax=Motiliproteus coralliicola TaxID=2283196 RepID=A0A369W9I7_9GAMM|nr:peptidoglycan editing factor PgeF [Motiliproteus coralliicola]RDE18502.1 peptidoglycan editing factor PgeF [Motiliproteus coralliicola]
MTLSLIIPDWPAPKRVRALSTTRVGGQSEAPYDSFNLGDHVSDQSEAVAANRRLLQQQLGPQVACQWLRQVHGIKVARLDGAGDVIEADASCTDAAGVACLVMTADCLPVLFCDREGSRVAAAHAGWRGLCDGVLEATIDAMQLEPAQLMCWLGPAIGPEAFEVGAEVRDAFIAHQPQAAAAFEASGNSDRWLADLYQLARLRLARAGVSAVYGGGECTYSNPQHFFSYRRDGQTGRMASLIWLQD